MKQLFNITIEPTVEAGQQVLALCIGEKYCSFAVTAKSGNRLHRLGYFTHENMDAGFLSELFSSQGLQDTTFAQVNIHFDSPHSVLVPLKYHQQDNRELFLRVMNGISGDNEIISESIPEWQLYNVFSVPENVSGFLKLRFPSVKYNHLYSTLIRTAHLNVPEGSIIVEFREGEFSVIVFKENKILLAQTFNYSNPADVVYHLLNICRHFSMSQSGIELQVAGLIEEQSTLYKELYQYFLRVTFRTAPDWGVIVSGENKYPAHYFATLNELVKCGSYQVSTVVER